MWIFAPPPSLQSAQTPWLAFMRPFMLQSPWQFRVGPPPSLTSHRYARDLNEIQAYGSATSTVRTPEQTAVAQFWNANATSQTNMMIAGVVTGHAMDAVDAARSFAIANMVDTDAGIACWDSKYHYTFWRPVTAIQHADIDGNPATTADPTWTPLLVTPNHPEYPAAHGCVTAAESEFLTSILHTSNIQVDYKGNVGGGDPESGRHTPLRNRERPAPRDRERARLGRAALPQLRQRGRVARQGRRPLRPRPLLPAHPPPRAPRPLGPSAAGELRARRQPGRPRS